MVKRKLDYGSIKNEICGLIDAMKVLKNIKGISFVELTDKDVEKWIELNTKYSETWPNITKKRGDDVPGDQEKWRDVKDKLKYFSEKPGKGD